MKNKFSILLYVTIGLIFFFHFFTKSYSLSIAIGLTTLIVTMYNIKIISLRRKEDMKTRIFIQPETITIPESRDMIISDNFYFKFNVENTGLNSAVNLSIDFKELDSNKYVSSKVVDDESIKVIRKTTIFPHKYKTFRHNEPHLLIYILSRFKILGETELKFKYYIKVNYFDSNYNKPIQRKTHLVFIISRYSVNGKYYISINNQPLLLKF